MSTSGRNHGIQWTNRMQLDNLDFVDALALLSHTQLQMLEKMASVALPSAAVSRNMQKRKARFSETTQHELNQSQLTEKICRM
ncbi:unnamed protein product [Schistosoma curassoni]|uniref:Transcriptional regulator n=1 Tax=Schistosoma curassoni TaxID=6186 RepID=A0A183JX56_9TREM|nr:unnamed protein product [Schistosoma curassoni]